MKFAKKFLVFFLLLSLILASSITINAQAVIEEIKAPAAILIEASTGKTLLEKNSNEKRPAS